MRITTYKIALDEDFKNILIKEKSINYESELLKKPSSIVRMMCDVFSLHLMAEEYLYMVCFNAKCKVLGVFEISHGNSSSSIMGIREIFIRNLLCGATGFVLIHNHPSSIPEPSDADILSTKRLKKAADLMGIDLLDHIIIGEQEHYYSMTDHALI